MRSKVEIISVSELLQEIIDETGYVKMGIIDRAKTDLERLVNGEIVEKDIREDLTYNELYASCLLYTSRFRMVFR